MKTIVNGVTTYYVGNHYEVKNSVVTKYYFAGATRLAVRTGGTLSFLLGDHIGSSSITTDANGANDADGKQVKTIVNGVTTYYVGNHYEVKNSVVTKYYFAGATRLAVRTGGTLSFLLGDHIGSSSITTDANGAKTASALYKAFGETRYTLGSLGTDYKFTGQRDDSYINLLDYGSRRYDPELGRFISPDSIVPTSTQGTQAWDRYAFVNNNPVRYNDPTGHEAIADGAQSNGCTNKDYCENGKPKTYCTDPSAENYHAAGSCVYPPKDNTEDPTFTVEKLLVENPDFDPFVCRYRYCDDSSEVEAENNELLAFYSSLGIDIEEYASQGLPNPLDYHELPGELQLKIIRNVTGPSTVFLNELDKVNGTDLASNINSFEPNYLFALMVSFPRILSGAIDLYNTFPIGEGEPGVID